MNKEAILRVVDDAIESHSSQFDMAHRYGHSMRRDHPSLYAATANEAAQLLRDIVAGKITCDHEVDLPNLRYRRIGASA